MCGISGFIDFSETSTKEVLQKMTDALIHRGPDGSGYEFFKHSGYSVGLGHRRLAIIDLSETGKQPMQFGDLWITFNGEIYNFREIKAELEKSGHQFIGHSDTEVILHAFCEWGIKCVDRFIGMFSFVIYDQVKEEVICVRDRAGVKPFFYYWNQNLFLFASELKSFNYHPDFKKEINSDAVGAFMQFGNIPAPHCIFNHCYKLKPGHYISFNLKTKELKEIKYWDVYDAYNKPKLDISFAEAKTETEKIMKSAFDYRMVSDVPVGVFLSGGYDSSLLTALLQKDKSEKLKTFTIGVPDIGLNEAEYAKDVAKHLGTEHYEFTCSQKEAIELIDDIPHYYDEPFADSSAIPTTLVSKMAKKQVTVALSADGGDEIFAGYNRYDYLMRFGKKLNKIPGFARHLAVGVMNWIPAEKIPVMKNKYNFHNRYEKLKGLLNDPSSQNLMLNLSRQYDDEQLKDVLAFKFKKLNTSYLSQDLKKEFYSPLSYMMAVDYQTYLVDDILQKVDRATMTASLEGREPFLDHRIIEWAAQLPDDFKYYKGCKKYILKEITHQYIPKKLMDRPKQGFAIPIENWLAHDLKEKVLYYLNDDKIKEQGIFKVDFIQKLKRDFYSGKKELAQKLWYVLMFQMWYEKWM
ncbi:MAG: asparagine synthase (glutamine-hydrolyzing) [Burkholderiales bacterium]|nr:asparagine synthase (glutamine-hydrolyzing) [Bacteroidia bacterium]